MDSEDKSKKMQRLLKNDDFVELILEDFIKQGTLAHSLHDNLRSEAVLDQLMARSILHNYLMTTIENIDTV